MIAHSAPPPSAPVLVVGAGPVGLTLALALARQGVPSVVLDEGQGGAMPRPARTVVLHPDTAALITRVTGGGLDRLGLRWSGWRALRGRRTAFETTFETAFGTSHGTADGGARPGDGAPLHLPQHALTGALRAAAVREPLVTLVPESRLDALEQDASQVRARARSAHGTWWQGTHLVGCDGARSTVRKLLDIRFPGRTAVERHAVATLRVDLPLPGTATLHRTPPWRSSAPFAGEVVGRPLPDGAWRLDWLMPPPRDPAADLVTADVLVALVRETLAGWDDSDLPPPYELLDTGVHTVHHRLARRWRRGRAFLAGDAAHLLGSLGGQGLEEGLRDAENLAWKLAFVRQGKAPEALLDTYQAERRAVVSGRLRAADQALPILRGGGLRSYVPGTARAQDALLVDGHLGRGALGGPGRYGSSPLLPTPTDAEVAVDTAPGELVEDVRVTAEDGSTAGLWERLGRGTLSVVLVAPGTGVWERRHWAGAGIMPALADAVRTLPAPAELLVTEVYPGAPAHTVLLVRPDGRLVTALSGVRPQQLRAAAEAATGVNLTVPGPSAPEPETERAGAR
ncbi:FAD-dependent monooxygenase [Streptomyces sp. CO7]